MEWMLQAVDEIDDLIGALRHCFLGLTAELGLAPPATTLKIQESRV
jgi:hypothetical protein